MSEHEDDRTKAERSAGNRAPGAGETTSSDPRTVVARGTGGSSKRVSESSGSPDAGPQPAPTRTQPDDSDESRPQSYVIPKPGERINQYEIIRLLGEGGMGTVFVARDTKLGRRVAVKFLRSAAPELTQRFIIEARATARCSHENIVVIHDVGEYDGTPYMVLEYLKGSPLTKLLKGGGRLPPARVAELMVPVVRALVCAHDQKIVHRDLKPDNIFVTESGTVKVLDFGIAKVLQNQGDARPPKASGELRPASPAELEGERTDLTRRGAIVGTLSYMSPEQWDIGIEIDDRTDIWAVGIMLFRMLAGEHPLAPLSGPALMVTAALDEPMPGVRTKCPDVPRALAEVVDKCLRKHKDQRFAGAFDLLRALEPFLPGRYTRELRLDESPYAGLAAFQEADADRFFGRSDEIAAFVTRIRDRPMMAVVGSSGVGKSSFVRAGAVPALKQSGEQWETLVVRPGRDPLGALASVLSPYTGSSVTVADEISRHEEIVTRLRREPGFLGTVLRGRARTENTKILLFVDQMEELYTLIADPAERAAFTQCLTGVADDALSPLRVVLSIRSDFLDRVAEDPHFMSEVSHGLFFIGAPNREGLRDAIVRPAEMAGFHFETPDTVEHLLDHLETTHGALPLLQFAASKLWDGRDTTRKLLTKHSYDSLGGIAGALASHADSVLRELSATSQALVRSIFLRLVTPERTRAIVSVAELRGLSRDVDEIQRLIDHLVSARLLVVQGGTDEVEGEAAVEIVHESLVHTWPTLRRWLDENQDDAVFLDQLRTAAKQWQAKGRDSGLLWRDEAMEEARRWHKRYRGELPEVQQAFLAEVFGLAARSARRRRMAVIGTIIFLSLLVAGAAVALLVIRDSQQEATAQAAAARKAEQIAKSAETEAKQRLAEVQEKERQRQQEEAARRQAQLRAARADQQVEMTNEELRRKNLELLNALAEAEDSRERAKKSQQAAERNEAAAVQAKQVAEHAENEALRAQQRTEKLLEQERRRVERLQEQLGSPMIDTLK